MKEPKRYRAQYEIRNRLGTPLKLTHDLLGRWRVNVYGHETVIDQRRADELIINAHIFGHDVAVSRWKNGDAPYLECGRCGRILQNEHEYAEHLNECPMTVRGKGLEPL